MRNLMIIASLVFGLSAYSVTIPEPELVDVPLGKVYTPVGFDSNDASQVVVAGAFANTCYQVGPHEVSVDHENYTVRVRQQAYLYDGMCLQVTVPFYEVLELGILNVGGYSIVDDSTSMILGQIPVALAKGSGPGTDEVPYAPVTDAFIVKDGTSGGLKMVLQGTFTNRCMKLKNVDVKYYDDVLVVLPTVEMLEPEDSDCVGGHFRFQKEVPLKPLKKHAYLIHVRSMNGKALNRVFDGIIN